MDRGADSRTRRLQRDRRAPGPGHPGRENHRRCGQECAAHGSPRPRPRRRQPRGRGSPPPAGRGSRRARCVEERARHQQRAADVARRKGEVRAPARLQAGRAVGPDRVPVGEVRARDGMPQQRQGLGLRDVAGPQQAEGVGVGDQTAGDARLVPALVAGTRIRSRPAVRRPRRRRWSSARWVWFRSASSVEASAAASPGRARTRQRIRRLPAEVAHGAGSRGGPGREPRHGRHRAGPPQDVAVAPLRTAGALVERTRRSARAGAGGIAPAHRPRAGPDPLQDEVGAGAQADLPRIRPESVRASARGLERRPGARSPGSRRRVRAGSAGSGGRPPPGGHRCNSGRSSRPPGRPEGRGGDRRPDRPSAPGGSASRGRARAGRDRAVPSGGSDRRGAPRRHWAASPPAAGAAATAGLRRRGFAAGFPPPPLPVPTPTVMS